MISFRQKLSFDDLKNSNTFLGVREKFSLDGVWSDGRDVLYLHQ